MRRLLALAVTASLFVAWADEEDGEETAAETKEEQKSEAKAAKVSFTTLPLCSIVSGKAEARVPNGKWEAADEGHFYPLGTSFRTGANGSLTLEFGRGATVQIPGEAEFNTRAQPLGESSRVIALVRGVVDLVLPDNTPEGCFAVAASSFVVKNPAGKSRYTVVDMGDGDKITVRCVTGTLALEGRHYAIPAMRPADEIVIRTSHDNLSTFLYGTSGDYTVKLDQGVGVVDKIDDDGTVKKEAEQRFKDWRLSPKTKVVINRAVPAIGERLSVHTMAFDTTGELRSECCFCENRAEINSGEMVPAETLDDEELAKRAAAAEEETTAAADVEDSAESSESSSDDSSDDDE